MSPCRPSDESVSYMLTEDPRRSVRKLPPSTPLVDRVLLRCNVDPDTGCWVFAGALTRGYAAIRHQRETHYGFHVVYETFVGPRSKHLWIDHKCDNPACCNPNHLQLLTPGENTLKGFWANGNPRRTHCMKGHLYAEVGEYIRPNGGRRCHQCIRDVYLKKIGATVDTTSPSL